MHQDHIRLKLQLLHLKHITICNDALQYTFFLPQWAPSHVLRHDLPPLWYVPSLPPSAPTTHWQQALQMSHPSHRLSGLCCMPNGSCAAHTARLIRAAHHGAGVSTAMSKCTIGNCYERF